MTPLTKSEYHWRAFREGCLDNGQRVQPKACNTKAGEALAEKHDRVLAIARFELEDEDLVAVLEETLTESLSLGEIGHDGIAAYWDARACLAAAGRKAA